MKLSRIDEHPLPPRLTMNEYADWISRSLRHGASPRNMQQKRMEERVLRRFKIPGVR